MTNAEYEALITETTVLYGGRQLTRTSFPEDAERKLRAYIQWSEERFGVRHGIRYLEEPPISDVIIQLDDWWRDGYPAMKARRGEA